MKRHELTDAQWKLVETLVPTGAGRPAKRGDRNFVNAVVWVAKTGAPWRDLPERFGPWKSIFNRFSNWCKLGLWEAIFTSLAFTDDDVAALMDGTVVRAHQDSSGGDGGPKKNCIGRSRGGCSTKIHAVTDSHRMPLRLILSQGQDHDVTQAEALLDAVTATNVVADSAYDSNSFRAAVEKKAKKLVVMPHPNRKNPPSLNKPLYAIRFNVERFFHDLKRFRRLASRYEKTARNYLGMAHVACSLLWVGVGCI